MVHLESNARPTWKLCYNRRERFLFERLSAEKARRNSR